MGPSTFPLGHDKFDEGSPIVYLLIKFCFTHCGWVKPKTMKWVFTASALNTQPLLEKNG